MYASVIIEMIALANVMAVFCVLIEISREFRSNREKDFKRHVVPAASSMSLRAKILALRSNRFPPAFFRYARGPCKAFITNEIRPIERHWLSCNDASRAH